MRSPREDPSRGPSAFPRALHRLWHRQADRIRTAAGPCDPGLRARASFRFGRDRRIIRPVPPYSAMTGLGRSWHARVPFGHPTPDASDGLVGLHRDPARSLPGQSRPAVRPGRHSSPALLARLSNRVARKLRRTSKQARISSRQPSRPLAGGSRPGLAGPTTVAASRRFSRHSSLTHGLHPDAKNRHDRTFNK